MKRIAVFGATSGVGSALCEEAARQGFDLVLVARDADRLAALASRLQSQSRQIQTLIFDGIYTEGHAALVQNIRQRYSDLSGAVFCQGVYHRQDTCVGHPEKVLEMMNCNCLGVISLLEPFADWFTGRGTGFLSCITSVAGDRVRASNYSYGASKAALSAYLDGLRRRLAATKVLIQDVKLGPTDTRMASLADSAPLLIAPNRAAREILAAIRRRKEVVYVPGFWRYIMAILKMIPEPLFKRLKI